MTNAHVRIFFHLTQDEDGYPAISAESVWAKPAQAAGDYVLDNIPFFAREATIGDTVRVNKEYGVFWFETLQKSSGNSLIRVVFFDVDVVGKVDQALNALGCLTEYSAVHKLLAVSVPGDVEVSKIQSYLQSEADAGYVDFEEPILRNL